jgi:hypothetical protein
MLWLALSAQLVALTRPDSAEVLRSARTAQARFEDFRLGHLPRYRGGSYGGRCDETIGRFCFRFGDDDDDDDWTPPPDPPAIKVERARLVATLDSLHRASPGDPWIIGQLVRYQVESAQPAQAVTAARTCRSALWWCGALTGYALHADRQYAAADSAFGGALAAMPEEQRCAWSDLSPLLDRLRAQYRKLTCAQRAPLERRIWWLADPLYLVPGNERRTEHHARRVMNALQDGARSGYHDRWGSDLEEVVTRYGWPVAWERNELPTLDVTAVHVTSHYAPHGRQFFPPAAFVEDPGTIRPDGWDLGPDRPVSEYAPAYAARFHDLPHQVAVFRRGDSIVVVAGYDVRTSSDGPGRERPKTRERELARKVTRAEAALVLAKDENAEPLIVKGSSGGPEGVMTAIAPAQSALLSLETLDTADSVHAARARYWLPVALVGGAVAVSDPLLLRGAPGDSLHPTLADVLPLVRPVAQARRGERVPVFWETYSLERSTQSCRVTLTVTQAGQGWLQRAAEWAGLAKHDPRYVAVSWEEPPSALPVTPRVISISMPNASPGTYLLDIAVALPGSAVARSSREITILP